uniref:Uncharacterized protein n=1 Tax=Rhizophora mucronata TaxID=61149 RepID=A0A2P2QBF9_RHIMU
MNCYHFPFIRGYQSQYLGNLAKSIGFLMHFQMCSPGIQGYFTCH